MKKKLLSLLLTFLLCLGLTVPAGAAAAPPNPFENMVTMDPLHQALLWAINQGMADGQNFPDVDKDHPFYTAIAWAVQNKIAAGYADSTFRPGNTCTRAQIAAFLWRAAGRPSPGSLFSDLTDVAPSMDADFYSAVLWIAGKGAVSGDTFDPYGPCTRQAAVELLWIAAGRPEAAETSSFTDVTGVPAVNWAVSKGITNGFGDGTFRPDSTCTRGQIAAFLYRAGADAFEP